MAETPSGPTIDPRLRDYLDAELRQAEADFPRLRRPMVRRARGGAPVGTLLGAAVVLLVAVFAGSQLLGRPNTGPAAIQLGADGVPTSIDGQPVLRGDEIAQRAGTVGSFLAGGTLALASDPCPTPAPPSAGPCTESWRLDSPGGSGPVFDLNGVSSAPGFVHTSGALTVVRVDGLGASTTPDALTVEAVVWRRPTKGPMPPNASPPQGGPIFDALVPDFVAAWNRDGTAIAGYVPKSYLVGPFPDVPGSPSNPPQAMPEPVYGDDLTTLVGHMVADVGFVPLGATPPSVGANGSVAPSPVGSPSNGPGTGPAVDCGRIAAAPCDLAIALARAGHEAEVSGATVIVVDDACAPLPVICDRLYPFDAIVVFVTAGADATAWYAFRVTGLEYSTPTKAEPWVDDLPAHIAQRLTAIAQPTPSVEPTAEPLPSGAPSADPTLICGVGGVEFSASVLDAPAELTGPDEAIQAFRAYLARGGYPGMPVDGWRTVASSDTSVTFLTRGSATWWSVTMTPDPAGGWQAWEEGECRLAVRLPTTMSYAEWRVDPKHSPKPGDTSVTVLATELSCAGGRPPGKRLQAPVIVETGTTVTITLLVQQLGNADCPSNSEVAVVVRLKAPLGTRTLLDGSTYPATER